MGFASWNMFTHVNRCWFSLKEGSGPKARSFSPWDDLPHSHLAMNENELKFYIFFLKRFRKKKLNGSILLRDGFKKYTLKVRNTNVVD